MTSGEPDPPADGAGGEASLSRRELQDRAIKGSMWTVIHTLVSIPLAFIVNVIIARVLGVVDYGRLAYLSTVMGVVGGIAELGIGTGLVQFGAKAHAVGRTEEVRRLLSATQGFRLLVVAPIISVVVISIARVDLGLLVIAVIFGVLLPAALGGAPACLTIENKTAAGAQIAMAINVLAQIAVVVTIVTIGTADAIWAVRLIIGGGAIALALFFVAPEYRRAVLRPSSPWRLGREFWRFAIPAGAAGLIGGLVVSRTEVLLLTWMSQPAAAGLFALAFALAGHIFAPAQALIGPLVPAISGLREVDEEAVHRALSRTLRAAATVVALLVSAALPAFAALVPLIYGQQYDEARVLMIALGIAGGFLVISGPIQAFVQARLLGTRILWVNLTALVVDVVLAVTLIPPLGVWGAVIANVAGSVTQLGILLAGEVKALGVRWVDAGQDLLPTGVGAAGCLGSWAIAAAVGIPPVPTSLVAGALGLGFVVLGLRWTRSGLAAGDAEAILRSMPARLAQVTRPLLAACSFRSAV